MTTGARISEFRAKAGISQNTLARKLGVSSGMVVSRWETGANKPSTDHLIALAREFGVSIDELWGSHEETVTAPTAPGECA